MKFGKNSIKLREVDVYNTELYTPESYSLSMKGIKLEDALNYEFSLVSLMKRWDASLENQIWRTHERWRCLADFQLKQMLASLMAVLSCGGYLALWVAQLSPWLIHYTKLLSVFLVKTNPYTLYLTDITNAPYSVQHDFSEQKVSLKDIPIPKRENVKESISNKT